VEEDVEVVFEGKKEIEKRVRNVRINGQGCIYILTSNYGANEIMKNQQSLQGKSLDHEQCQTIVKAILDKLTQGSPPRLRNEFLGRITATIPFLVFTDDDIQQAVALLLNQWKDSILKTQWQTLLWTQSVVDLVHKSITFLNSTQ
jgi:ATP-dependent Clp protease ATP-binding subunit ClpA